MKKGEENISGQMLTKFEEFQMKVVMILDSDIVSSTGSLSRELKTYLIHQLVSVFQEMSPTTPAEEYTENLVNEIRRAQELNSELTKELRTASVDNENL
jgi:hypothetical protein